MPRIYLSIYIYIYYSDYYFFIIIINWSERKGAMFSPSRSLEFQASVDSCTSTSGMLPKCMGVGSGLGQGVEPALADLGRPWQTLLNFPGQLNK